MKKIALEEGEISYLIQGKGPLSFLLIHNAGGSHEMMLDTAAHFFKHGKTVLPDLLGHGASTSPKIEYTLDVFAKTLIQLCEYEKLNRVVFIGLNYGANIGIAIAQMLPQLISHLVLIEPPILMEPWLIQSIEQHIKDLNHSALEWAQETVDSVLLKASSHKRDTALKALKSAPSFVKASTYKHLLDWDRNLAFHSSIPTLMIQTTQPFCTEERARTLFSQLQVGRVVASGPWATLETPTQVHSMIDRFLEVYA